MMDNKLYPTTNYIVIDADELANLRAALATAQAEAAALRAQVEAMHAMRKQAADALAEGAGVIDYSPLTTEERLMLAVEGNKQLVADNERLQTLLEAAQRMHTERLTEALGLRDENAKLIREISAYIDEYGELGVY